MDPMTMMMLKEAGGAGTQAGVGGFQLLQGHIQRKRADKLQPALEDPQQLAAMQEYQRRANNAMTGATVAGQARELEQLQGAGLKALSRGGNLNQASTLQRIQSRAMNDLLAQGQQTELSYRTMFNDALKGVADRRMRMQSKKADAMALRAERNIGAGTQNLMAGISSLSKGKDKKDGGVFATPMADGGASKVADRGLMASQGGAPGAIPGITQPELGLGSLEGFSGIGSMMGGMPLPM